MVQVIQSNRQKPPSFMQSILGGIAANTPAAIEKYQGMKLQQQQMSQENEAAKRMGIDLSGISDPKVRQEIISNSLKGQTQGQQNKFLTEENERKFNRESNFKVQQLEGKNQKENDEKIIPLQNAIQTVNRMREIRSGGKLGRGSAIWGAFGGDTAKARGEYETLGNSLIQYASTIPIRNKIEFEKLAGKISDPSTTDAEAEGILDAMEDIISKSMPNQEGNADESSVLNSLSDSQIQELYQASGGNLEKAKKLAIERFGKR